MQNLKCIIKLVMKGFMLLFIALLVFTSCGTKQKAPVPENIEQTILALDRQALDLLSKGDPLGFAELFAEDGTYFDDIGSQTRLNGLTEIRNYFASLSGKIPAHKYEMVNPKFQIYDNIAILTYQYRTTMPDNQPGALWKVTQIYHFTDDKWQLVHAHWSVVKEQ
jgi:uncharacterized protein (TIGR02246 family)